MGVAMSARGKLKAPIVAALVGVGLLLAGSPASAAPPNDDIADAKVISGFPFYDTFDRSGATTAPDDPDCFGNAATGWYVFTANTDTDLRISTWTPDEEEVTLSAYTGTRGDLEQVACVGRGSLTVNVLADQTVYVMVGSHDERTIGGEVFLVFESLPRHRDITKAEVITTLPYHDSSHQWGVEEWGWVPVWYRIDAANDSWIRVEMGHFESFRVWRGSPGSLRSAGCHFMGDEAIRAACHLKAGHTYYIEAQGFDELNLRVYESGPYRLVALSGDWNGDGRDTVGWYEDGIFYLSKADQSGRISIAIRYGKIGDMPVVGDWDGDGRDTIGVRRGNMWELRNRNSAGAPHLRFRYGRAGDIPVVGDWNGNGRDTVGVRRGRTWYLRNRNSAGAAHHVFGYGRTKDTPVVGDWNRDGRDTVGVRRDKTWYLRNRNSAGVASSSFAYGRSSDLPVTGDWNADGRDTVGVARGGYDWLLRNRNSSGPAQLRVDFPPL
jgi:hypothetical protein